MNAPTSPPVFALIAGLLVLWTPLVPAHVHDPDTGASETTVHRHFLAHVVHGHGAEFARLDHPDAPIVWLTESWLHAQAYHIDQPVAAAPFEFLLDADTNRGRPPRFNEVAPPHGPPRPDCPLRAPPLSRPAAI